MKNGLGSLLDCPLPLSKRVTVRAVDGFVLLLISAFAVYARLALFDFVSGDYTGFLSGWFDSLKAAGGIPGIGLSIGDYTPPYLYLMSLLTYLPLDSLYSIKLLSCVFDFLLAIYVMKLVFDRRQSPAAAVAAYGLTLFAPTVLFNSAFWAQCDGIFVSFLLMSLFSFLRERPAAGMIFFSVAFVFKLQAIFFAPFLIVLFLQNRIRLRHFLFIPGIYLASILPAFFAGRPFGELLTIYLGQTARYSRLSLNAPNLYIFIAEDTTKALSMAAILLCGAAVLVTLYLIYRSGITLDRDMLVLTALFFAILLPYLLPHMHERYFYLADVLALVFAFYRPRRFYLPAMVIFASFAGYIPFLFGHSPIDLRVAAVVMGAALALTGYDLFRSLLEAWPSEEKPEP